jgi:hypothetical protein
LTPQRWVQSSSLARTCITTAFRDNML